MADIDDVSIKLGLDTSGVNTTDATNQVKSFAEKTHDLWVKVTDDLRSFTTIFQQEFERVGSVIQPLGDGLQSVGNATKSVGTGLDSMVDGTLHAAKAMGEFWIAIVGLPGLLDSSATASKNLGTAIGDLKFAWTAFTEGITVESLAFSAATGAMALAVEKAIQWTAETDALIEKQALFAASTKKTFEAVAELSALGSLTGESGATNDLFSQQTAYLVAYKTAADALKADYGQFADPAARLAMAANAGVTPATQLQIAASIESLKDIADPVARADAAVQLFGEHANEALGLMNRDLKTATEDAYSLANTFTQTDRESMDRIAHFFDGLKASIKDTDEQMGYFTASTKQLIVQIVTMTESQFHTFFLQNAADARDSSAAWDDWANKIRNTASAWIAFQAGVDEGKLNLLLQFAGKFLSAGPGEASQALGFGVPSELAIQSQLPSLTGFTPQGLRAPGVTPPLGLQGPPTADIVQALADPQAVNNAKKSIDQISLSYDDLTGKLGAAKSELTGLQQQFLKNPTSVVAASALANMQDTVNGLKGMKDSLDEVTLAWAAFSAAQSKLSVPDVTATMQNLQSAFATLQLSGMMTDSQMSIAASHLKDDLEKLTLSVRGGKDALDDYGNAVNEGPSIGGLANLKKAIDAAADAVPHLMQVLNSWHINAAPIQTAIDELSKFQTVADNLADHMARFPKTMGGLDTANLKQELSQLTGMWDAPEQAIITVQADLKALANSFVGTIDILKSQGQVPMTQLAAVAKTAGDDFATITANVTKGTATIHDQALAYGFWQAAVEKVTNAQHGLAEMQLVQTNVTKQRLADEIKWAELTGADATKQIIQLDNITEAQKRLYEQTHLLGDTYKSFKKDFDDAFTGLTKGITDNLFEWKNWQDTLINIGENLAKNLLNTFLTGLFAPLKAQLDSAGGLFSSLSGLGTRAVSGLTGHGFSPPGIPGLGGGGFLSPKTGAGGFPVEPGSAAWDASFMNPSYAANPLGGGLFGAGPALPGANELPLGTDITTLQSGGGYFGAPTGLTGVEASSGPLEAVSSSGGGLSGVTSLMSTFSGLTGGNPVGAITQILSGITQGIQMSRLANLLGEIEISTRQTKEQLVGGIQTSLNTYLPELKHLVDIWGTLNEGKSGVSMVYVMNWPGQNELNADFALMNNPIWQNNNAPPPVTGGGSDVNTGTPTGASVHQYQTNVMRGTNPLALKPFHTDVTPAGPAGPQLAPGEFVPGPMPLPSMTGLDTAGNPAMSQQDFLSWAKAMQANGDPALQTQALNSTKAVEQFSYIGKTAADILDHLQKTSIGTPSDQGPLTSSLLGMDPDFSANLKNAADFLAGPEQQKLLKANLDAVNHTNAILQQQYADQHAKEVVNQSGTSFKASDYTDFFKTLIGAGGHLLPGGLTAAGPQMGGASTATALGGFSSDQIQGAMQDYAAILQDNRASMASFGAQANATRGLALDAVTQSELALLNPAEQKAYQAAMAKYGNTPQGREWVINTYAQIGKQHLMSGADNTGVSFDSLQTAISADQWANNMRSYAAAPVNDSLALSQYQTKLTSQGIPTVGGFNPFALPPTGIPNYGGTSASGGGGVPGAVTVNVIAGNNDGRSIARTIVSGLQQMNVRVR